MIQKPKGFNAFCAFHWDDITPEEKKNRWEAMEGWQRERWERMAKWVVRAMEESESKGYCQGDRDGISRAHYRPGYGEMGG